MLSVRSRFRVLSEIAEEEQLESSLYSENGSVFGNDQNGVKKERRRKKIQRELFETEKTYLHHLQLVNKHFDFPLRFNCLIPDDVHGKIFSNIEQIMEVNQKLLEFMEQTTIGEAFKYLGPFLKLYASYANNHETALSTLQDYMQKSSEFTEFIHTQEDRPDMNGLKINALLITPVQRIPRYKLLLEDLLQSTPEDHHDYQQIKEAATQVSEIATHINDHIRQHDNFQKMLSIQNSFDNSAPKILAPGREFIKEGVLKKVSRRGGKIHDRMFFLFSDMLIYGKPKFLDSGKKSYSCCCVLPLKHCQVEKVFGDLKKGCSDGGGTFSISCKDENLVLVSNDKDEVKHWVDTLNTAIKKLCNNRSTLRKPSSHKAPLRGKSLLRIRKKEKKEDAKMRISLQGLKEDSKEGEGSSPCLKSGLSPLRAVRALSDIDLTECMSPNKKPKLSDKVTGATCTPTLDEESCTRSGKRIRPLSMISSNMEYIDQENMSYNGIMYEEATQSQDTLNNSDLEVENTFMQTTVHLGSIDSLDLDENSFCERPRKSSLKEEDTCTNNAAEVHVYNPQKRKHSESTSCTNHPIQRLLEGGRRFSRRCRKAFGSVNSRIHETKENCVIQ